jgi:hypothetical protein
LLERGWGCTQGAVARGLASLGVEFSEEAVEPVTGYRVDMLLHGGDGGATGRCAVEVRVGTMSDFAAAHHHHNHCAIIHNHCTVIIAHTKIE